jgi:hypothetical protein
VKTKSLLAAATLLLSSATWACSSPDNGADLFAPSGAATSEPEPEPDAGTAHDAATKPDANKTLGADGGEKEDAGVEIEDAGTCTGTATLHPRDPATGLYCPFRPGAANCGVGEHCCQPSSGSSTCASACVPTIAVDWACQGPSDCETGVCCGVTQLQPTTCGLTGKLFRGTRCQTSCAAAKDEITLCDRPTQCGATERCEPFRARGAELGACIPR